MSSSLETELESIRGENSQDLHLHLDETPVRGETSANWKRKRLDDDSTSTENEDGDHDAAGLSQHSLSSTSRSDLRRFPRKHSGPSAVRFPRTSTPQPTTSKPQGDKATESTSGSTAMKRYFTSKKEAANRTAKNKVEIHKKRQATYERKKEKAKRRLQAVPKKSKWTKEKKKKKCQSY